MSYTVAQRKYLPLVGEPFVATTTSPAMAEALRNQRAALEALATTLESMEEDTRIAVRENRAAAHATREFIANLEKEVQRDSDSREKTSADLQEAPLTVMLASSSRWRRALMAEILPEGFKLAENPISPDIDEKAIRRDDPEDMVKAIVLCPDGIDQ